MYVPDICAVVWIPVAVILVVVAILKHRPFMIELRGLFGNTRFVFISSGRGCGSGALSVGRASRLLFAGARLRHYRAYDLAVRTGVPAAALGRRPALESAGTRTSGGSGAGARQAWRDVALQ